MGSTKTPALERRLAGTLTYGSWVASAVIALGTALVVTRGGAPSSAEAWGAEITRLGIALLILLPVLRVTLMLAAFLRAEDHRLSVAAALVLLILVLAFVLGARA